jgi:hypothetical protein
MNAGDYRILGNVDGWKRIEVLYNGKESGFVSIAQQYIIEQHTFSADHHNT